MRKLAVLMIVVGLATAASAAQSPGQKCQSSKNQEAGKYANCLARTEAKLLKTKGACSVATGTVCYDDGDCPNGETCAKDLTKYGQAVSKCEGKFELKWVTLTQKAAGRGDPCPDGLQQVEVKEVLDECLGSVAAGLAGEGLSACSGELLTCEDDLTGCESDLGAVETDLATCESDLTTCDGNLTACDSGLTTCDSDLTTCEGDLAVALECGDGGIDAGEDCDLGSLNGSSCVGEGFAGGVLRCSTGCLYDTSECWSARFEDNADGTITDNDTGLMWEKKVGLDSTTDLANLQDADNFYRWSGSCSVATSKRCQPDAASEAACLASVEGDPTGCSQCTGGEGTCTVGSPGVTVWQWLASLNTANHAGHSDWRVARKGEYVSIIDDADTTPPVVNVAFHGASCGGACTDVTDPACSCTQSYGYWSASTYAPFSFNAWVVSFDDGYVTASYKATNTYVRAVRGGS